MGQQSDKPHDVFGRYHDDAPRDQPWCKAGIVLSGEWFPCDLVPPHDGWAHGNREAEAIWQCGDDPLPPRHSSWEWQPEPHLKGEQFE